MKKQLIILSVLFANYSVETKAGWLDFMGKAVSSVGNVAKSAGTAAMGGAKCNMMKSQGMMNTPQYYQECVQTGLAPPPMGMGMGMGMQSGLPYGVTPVTTGNGTSNVTLQDNWSDDPLAGAGSSFPQAGMMGGGMMNPMMGGGMMGGGMMGGQPGMMGEMPPQGQSTSFSSMIGHGLVNNLMGGNRGAPPGGAYGQPGYGAQPGYRGY